LYGRTPEQRNDWRAAPLLADLAGLPPAQLIVGRLDPLLDDSAAPVTSAAHRIFKYTVA
jgi:acetyl esterase/lipase